MSTLVVPEAGDHGRTADTLTAGTLTAGTLTAGTLTAGTLTTGTLTTANRVGSDVAEVTSPLEITFEPEDITSGGASEAAWRDAIDRAGPRAMDWGSPGRVIVVAPHPDDEILAAGGAMQQLAQRGFSVLVVAVTDGEAAQPDAAINGRRWLAAVRACERREALEALGLGQLGVVRAYIPDGGVAEREQELAELLAELLEHRDPRLSWTAPGPTWCLAPWRQDGHPDHEAAGRAAAAAAKVSGSKLLEYPVWAWQWMRPEDRRFPWQDLRLEPLSRETQCAKQRAVAAFTSQIEPWGSSSEPILSPETLQRFARPFEGFLRPGAPA
jgi:LmbE family N-acetylglucosaminyl deacetylase